MTHKIKTHTSPAHGYPSGGGGGGGAFAGTSSGPYIVGSGGAAPPGSYDYGKPVPQGEGCGVAGYEGWELEAPEPYPNNLWVRYAYRMRDGETQRVLVVSGTAARKVRDTLLAIVSYHSDSCAIDEIKALFEGINDEPVCGDYAEDRSTAFEALDAAADAIARARQALAS